MIPARISEWVKKKYPKPRIDIEWLQACYDYLVDEIHISPDDFDQLIENIESQLLQSDLADSTVQRSGLPANVAAMHAISLPPFILLQVASCTEIGHSAFSLQTARQAWLDKADLAGLAVEDDAEDDVGDAPRYPRGMLSMELSDGYTTVKAVEYRKLDTLKLGQVSLGYKIVLKNVPIRRGVALLQPANVELKGYQNDELDLHREAVFLRGLRTRMGLPPDEEPPPQSQPQPQPQPQARDQGHGERRPSPPPERAASPPLPHQPPNAGRSVATAPLPPGNQSQPHGEPSRSRYFAHPRSSPPVGRLSPLPTRTGEHRDRPPSLDPDMDETFFEDMDETLDPDMLLHMEALEREAGYGGDTGTRNQSRQPAYDLITIEDSDEDEKENVPLKAPKRAARRTPPDVIELSD